MQIIHGFRLYCQFRRTVSEIVFCLLLFRLFSGRFDNDAGTRFINALDLRQVLRFSGQDTID